MIFCEVSEINEGEVLDVILLDEALEMADDLNPKQWVKRYGSAGQFFRPTSEEAKRIMRLYRQTLKDFNEKAKQELNHEN